MLTTTGTLGVNAAFLQEIKDDGRELMAIVRTGRRGHGTSAPAGSSSTPDR